MAAIRLFGRVILCGVLYVAWQSRTDVQGRFMACILFRSYLILATPESNGQTFAVVACISLESLKLEPADSGRGASTDHRVIYTD